MRFLYYLFFFLPFTVSSQIDLKIDSITAVDSIPNERKFIITYHIENLGDKEISFFLNTNGFVPNSRASMSTNIVFKVFQKDEFIDIDNIFGNRKANLFTEKMKAAKTDEERKTIMDAWFKELNIDTKSEIEEDKNDEDYYLKQQSKRLMSDVFTIKPKEKITFTKVLLWDKRRYLKFDDKEFYLDEKTPHYFELTLNLMKEQFKEKLLPEDYEKIMKNPYFINGWIVSNKMEINFGE